MAEEKYSDKFEQSFNFTRNFSELCGVDVVKQNYKICWKTAFVFVLVNAAISLTFYSIYTEVTARGNYIIILKSASILGTGIQGYAKLINLIKEQSHFRVLHKEICGMYRTYELQSLPYKKCLGYNLSLIKKLLVTVFAVVMITSIFVIGIPIYMIIIWKERTDVLPFQLPFLDRESAFGFYSRFIVQVVCVLFGALGNFVSDSWLFIFTAHIPMLKNILKCKFDDLDNILETNPKSVEKTKGQLNDIFKWHQKYISFCDTIKTTFFWVIFVQIGTEFFGIIFTTICIFLGIWPPAPAYLFYLFTIVYSYCALGNLVEVSNDDITTMIYDSCWYKLTVPEQKMILIMLRESQQEATSISIGGVAPLTLNTALKITKTIYTFSMMLKEFLH